jgi:hypothetical protein
LYDIAGVLFTTPVEALKLIENRTCAVFVVESVPQLYKVESALSGP